MELHFIPSRNDIALTYSFLIKSHWHWGRIKISKNPPKNQNRTKALLLQRLLPTQEVFKNTSPMDNNGKAAIAFPKC